MSTTPGAVADWAFVVPADWARVRVVEPWRTCDIAALACVVAGERLPVGVDPRPDAGRRVRELFAWLDVQLPVPGAHGTLQLHLAVASTTDSPVAASLVVAERPVPTPGLTRPELLRALVAAGAGVARPGDSPEPAVRSVRRVPTALWGRSVPADAVDVLTVQHTFVAPDCSRLLVLGFSTPIPDLEDQLAALADAVAASVRWEPSPLVSDGSAA